MAHRIMTYHFTTGTSAEQSFLGYGPNLVIKTGYHWIKGNRLAFPDREDFFEVYEGIERPTGLLQVGAQFDFSERCSTMKNHQTALLVGAVLVACVVAATAADSGFKVVVNEANPINSVSKEQLSRCFMKQLNTWSSGITVIPIDQTASSRVREEFSRDVHGRDVNAVKSFWQRQIFSGRGVPPPELASDREVLEFVRANPGAVGYVSSSATPGDGVKVLAVTE